MSAAIIYGQGDTGPGVVGANKTSTLVKGAGVARVLLTDNPVNQDGVVVAFNSSSSAENPNTFALAAGEYRIEVQFVGVQLQSSATLQSFSAAIYDENANAVAAPINPCYYSRSSGSGRLRRNALFRGFAKVTIPSGQRLLSARIHGFEDGGTTEGHLYYYEHGVTATLGGAVLPDRPTTIKIVKTA